MWVRAISLEARTDPRVINLERTNIRYATKEQIPDPIDFISVDVSFISLKLVLPVAKLFMRDGAQAVCLIKLNLRLAVKRLVKRAWYGIRTFIWK